MDKSYGINVARLAGLPEDLLERANEILNHFEERKVDVAPVFTPIKKEEKSDKSEVEEMIRKIDPLTLSPLEALNMLFEMKKKVK